MKFYSGKRLLDKYSRDKSIYKIRPSSVVFPKSEKEVIEIVRFAQRKNLYITPRGGGTGLSGAAIGKGIIIDFSKYLNKTFKIGEITRTQSGILLKKLRPLVEKKGYLLPSVPLHGDCTIGGNINTRSVGPKTLYYGTIDNQVKSLRGVLADGKILDTSKQIPEYIVKKVFNLQKKIKKEKALITYLMKRPFIAGGYNLKSLLKFKKIEDIINHIIVGSTGSLLLLTEVEFKLPKFKGEEYLYLIHFENINSLQTILNRLLLNNPVSMEYLDSITLNELDKKYRNKNSIGAILVGFEKNKNIGKLIKGALLWRKIHPEEKKQLWKSRQLILPKLEKKANKMNFQLPSGLDDFSFHPKKFSKIMTEILAYTKKHKLKIAAYGHIGIGSLHLRPFLNIKKNPKILDKITKDIFKILHKYDGTLIGEHNSGLCHSRYLGMESKSMYKYMKEVKKIFDPNNIFNPKVIFNLDKITKHIKI